MHLNKNIFVFLDGIDIFLNAQYYVIVMLECYR